MTTQLSLGQIFLLASVGGLTLLYVFYFRIWLALAIGSDLLFVAALAATVASIAIPAPFALASADLVGRSPLPGALDAADARVAQLEALPSTLLHDALEGLGFEPEPLPAAPSPAPPGPFTSRVRPSVETLVALTLRGCAFACAGFLMLTALATRSSTTTARRLRDLTIRIEALERERARVLVDS